MLKVANSSKRRAPKALLSKAPRTLRNMKLYDEGILKLKSMPTDEKYRKELESIGIKPTRKNVEMLKGAGMYADHIMMHLIPLLVTSKVIKKNERKEVARKLLMFGKLAHEILPELSKKERSSPFLARYEFLYGIASLVVMGAIRNKRDLFDVIRVGELACKKKSEAYYVFVPGISSMYGCGMIKREGDLRKVTGFMGKLYEKGIEADSVCAYTIRALCTKGIIKSADDLKDIKKPIVKLGRSLIKGGHKMSVESIFRETIPSLIKSELTSSNG